MKRRPPTRVIPFGVAMGIVAALQPAVATADIPPPVGAAPRGPVVTIVTESPQAELQQRQVLWQGVCRAPCLLPLDANGFYRMVGQGLNESEPFRLPRPDGTVVVQAHMGSKNRRRIGFAAGMVGLGMASLGGYLFLTNNKRGPDVPPGQNADNTVPATFAVVVGAVMSVVGLAMFWTNATSIDVH